MPNRRSRSWQPHSIYLRGPLVTIRTGFSWGSDSTYLAVDIASSQTHAYTHLLYLARMHVRTTPNSNIRFRSHPDYDQGFRTRYSFLSRVSRVLRMLSFLSALNDPCPDCTQRSNSPRSAPISSRIYFFAAMY